VVIEPPLKGSDPLVNRRLFPTLLVALGVLALPTTALAAKKVNVIVGVGDQSPSMFADANWQALGIKTTRYFIEWNAIDQPDEIAQADQFMGAARQAGVKVLVHISTDDINSVPVKPLPSVSDYKAKVKQLIDRYKAVGVTDWGAWNEANHKSQPTSKNPKRAAQFYKVMKRMCSGCKVVALDVLDQSGVESYVKRWLKAVGKSEAKKVRIVGIHNYSQVNRRITEKKASSRYPGTARIIKAVRKKARKAKFWYTETGGVANFGSAFPCDRSRQANRTKFMFSMIKTYDKDVERLYSYNWFGTGNGGCDGFDAGLVEQDGTVRPAYTAFKKGLQTAKR